ncbi:hypothetical protein [Frondihabitans sucicola]|uniref:hypothetical protein n=1 Tax=Frondihabitans sucicola TaxID=1268041 RepID=UPI002573CA7C|nr:hypothetical protein [Frondihabitans sucicola]
MRTAAADRRAAEALADKAAWDAERVQQDALGAEFVEWLVANDVPPAELFTITSNDDPEFTSMDYSRSPIGQAWGFWLNGSEWVAVTTEGKFIAVDTGPSQRLGVYRIERFRTNESDVGSLRRSVVKFMAEYRP